MMYGLYAGDIELFIIGKYEQLIQIPKGVFLSPETIDINGCG